MYNRLMDIVTLQKVYVSRAMTWAIMLFTMLNFLKAYQEDIARFLPIGELPLIILVVVLSFAAMSLFGWWDYKFGTGQREYVVSAKLNPQWNDVYNAVVKRQNDDEGFRPGDMVNKYQ